MRNSVRASCDGPRTYAHIHSPEVCGGTGYRVHQGQECNMDRQTIWSSEKFHRTEFLGQRYCVSTIGLDEDVVRDYIKRREDEDKKLQVAHGF
jgi:hypothetical protein